MEHETLLQSGRTKLHACPPAAWMACVRPSAPSSGARTRSHTLQRLNAENLKQIFPEKDWPQSQFLHSCVCERIIV